MNKVITLAGAVAACALVAACGGGQGGSRDQIRAVGSSTVYPFAKVVADQLVKDNPSLKSPIVETNGTGGGMKLFCAGVGSQFPDIADASRRIKADEWATCQKNGVTEVAEIQVGIDGIAFANAKQGPSFPLTPVDVYKAIAANPFGKPNTAKTWADVNPALPAVPIQVYGPATISGTRDALKELILAKGCDSDEATKALKKSAPEKHEAICGELRTDGGYADTSDNYNLIVQKLAGNPQAVGIFGYSYLESNADKLKGLTMGGVAPSYETISNFTYPGARPLFIYVKKAHVDAIPGLKDYVAAWVKAWGKDGPLAKAGMIVMPDDVQAKNAKAAADLPQFDASALK